MYTSMKCSCAAAVLRKAALTAATGLLSPDCSTDIPPSDVKSTCGETALSITKILQNITTDIAGAGQAAARFCIALL